MKYAYKIVWATEDEDSSDIVRLTPDEAKIIERTLARARAEGIVTFYEVERHCLLNYADFKPYLPLCPDCHDQPHTCANCDGIYCDCTIKEWTVGKNGITYCSRGCAENYSN